MNDRKKNLPIFATLADNIQIPIMNGVCTLSKSTIATGKSIGCNVVDGDDGGGEVDVSSVTLSIKFKWFGVVSELTPPCLKLVNLPHFNHKIK